MADSPPTRAGRGCLSKLVSVVSLALACSLALAVFSIFQPQDLSDIGGHGATGDAVSSRDLNTVLKSTLDRGYSVAITEAELNQWLGRTLVAKQGGLLAKRVPLKRVWVRLAEGHAEVIMERTLMGRPFTISMFLTIGQTQEGRSVNTEIHRHGGPYGESLPFPLRGGRFGKLVVPQGFLILVMPAYAKLAEIYHEEIRMAFQEMARIRIEPDRLLLDSRPPGDSALPFQTF